MGDAVGWGFVVRGMAPCYVQAVDPGSPAAAAGVKVTYQEVLTQYTNTHLCHLSVNSSVILPLLLGPPVCVPCEWTKCS